MPPENIRNSLTPQGPEVQGGEGGRDKKGDEDSSGAVEEVEGA